MFAVRYAVVLLLSYGLVCLMVPVASNADDQEDTKKEIEAIKAQLDEINLALKLLSLESEEQQDVSLEKRGRVSPFMRGRRGSKAFFGSRGKRVGEGGDKRQEPVNFMGHRGKKAGFMGSRG